MTLTIIVIILLLAVLFLAVMIILLWLKLNKKQNKKTAIPGKEKISTETLPQKAQQNIVPPKPKAEVRQTKIPKPNISPNARIETLTEAYTNLAGVIGALISDRFGQTIAVDTNLFIDKNTVSAQFVEILAMAKSDKSRNVLMVGEGSYWIFSDIATLPIGIWIERDVSLNDGIELFENYKIDVINALKKYYTQIW